MTTTEITVSPARPGGETHSYNLPDTFCRPDARMRHGRATSDDCDVLKLCAALDWAGVYARQGKGSYGPLAQELAAARRYALAIAAECETFAQIAEAERTD